MAVLSIEEYMANFREQIKDRVSKVDDRFLNMISDVKEEGIEDYSGLVLDYLDRRGLSYSALKRFRESPLSFIEYLTAPYIQTDAMKKGSLVDCILTEPEKFNEKYYIITEPINRRSNEGKAIWNLYLELCGNRDIITEDQLEDAIEISKAVYKNSDSKYYIEKKKNGQVWFKFRHRGTGYNVKGCLDWHSDPNDQDYFLCDLKTTSDASREAFVRQAAKMDYNLQCGVYTTAWKTLFFEFPDWINVVVENKSPYNVNVFRATKEYIETCQEEFENTMLAFKMCVDQNLWNKSYDFLRMNATTYDPLTLPGYYKQKF